MTSNKITFTSVKFTNFKALRNFSLSLGRMNILVGPNNCGKSTIISAFRILDIALRQAFTRKATSVPSINGKITFGHIIPEDNIPVPLENVHTDYEETESRIEFRISNGNRIILYFPADEGCIITWETEGKTITTPGLLKKAFPINIKVIPVLGPLEHKEELLHEDTIKRNLTTHRASRHFRNYWRYYPDDFKKFADIIASTWPGMQIEAPTLLFPNKLSMMCFENRKPSEIYWSGFGFQVWCQLLTHISRISRTQDTTILVVDEPEIYLHPDVQRQLLGILRDIEADILLATHSTEIIADAEASEILLVDKTKNSAERVKNIEGIQKALDQIGSIQNITLTHLARTKKILFVEDLDDYKIIRRFARKLSLSELSSGNDITALKSGGFSSWEKVKSLS